LPECLSEGRRTGIKSLSTQTLLRIKQLPHNIGACKRFSERRAGELAQKYRAHVFGRAELRKAGRQWPVANEYQDGARLGLLRKEGEAFDEKE
jgi:hypothetical protein